ncbi:MAG: helix-turn-helix domain-containing protein, partial [Pseudonocardiaceae bacterium]
MRVAREDVGLSLSAMAARTHYTRGYLSNVETGKRAATAEVVPAYERVLKKDVDRREILTGLTASVIAPAAVSELLFKGFAAAIGSRPSLDDWLERVEAYGRDYMSVGASELQ